MILSLLMLVCNCATKYTAVIKEPFWIDRLKERAIVTSIDTMETFEGRKFIVEYKTKK